jgi:hypothetical protein
MSCEFCERNICLSPRKNGKDTFCCQCYFARTEEFLYESCLVNKACKICQTANFKCTNCGTGECEFIEWEYGLGGEDGIYCCDCTDSRGPMIEECKCDNCRECSSDSIDE